MRITLYQRVAEDEREFLGALNQDMAEMSARISRAAKARGRIVKARIRTGGTEIRHGLGRVPRHVSVSPKADIRWWEYKARTADSLFLKSSADADVEVRIEG